MNNINQIRSQIDRDIFDYQSLIQCLSSYTKPRDKIQRLMEAGDIIRVKKGLYAFGEACRRSPISRELLANLIYGPSYISLDYALAWHGLIPERVTMVTSVTTGRSREFRTPFGNFSYMLLSEPRYTVGVSLERHGNESFLLASPEKALADKVYADKRFAGAAIKDYGPYLEHDLRLDMDRLRVLDGTQLDVIGRAYRSSKIERLIAYINRLKKDTHA